MATARLKTRYKEEILPALTERFGYSTPMRAPRITKVTVNMGVGDAKQDSKMLEAATEQLATITGQRPNVRRARKSIAQFKVREGMPVGVAVTLRGGHLRHDGVDVDDRAHPRRPRNDRLAQRLEHGRAPLVEVAQCACHEWSSP